MSLQARVAPKSAAEGIKVDGLSRGVSYVNFAIAVPGVQNLHGCKAFQAID